MRRLVPLLVIAALATPARADIWKHAIESGSGDAARDRYEQALHDGDDFAQRANAKGQNSVRIVTSLVDQAEHAYRMAAEARPQEGEPYFRIATLLQSFFTECNLSLTSGQRPPPTCTRDGAKVDAVRAKAEVDAWDAFEARAPLDPRVGEALFSRAILRTKLVTTSADSTVHLEGALKDYTALLDRADGLTMLELDEVWGNLAETQMMLGRLDDSIEAYQLAIDKGADSSTYYGKAVALDRDERGTEALELIRRQGPEAFATYREKLARGLIFYVPAGEEFYYFALIYEAFGYTTESIANWKLFLKSGAHPQYQPRAKAHLDALSVKQQTTPARPRPALDPFDVYP
jgi:tetratricopeptide (TPR) repeat protein